MQPADRKQVRQSGIAHRLVICFCNAPPVPTGQRGRNGSGRTIKVCPDMFGKFPLSTCNGPASPLLQNLYRTDHTPGRSNPREPGRPREIISTGKHGCGRRDEPGTKANARSFHNRSGRLIQRQVQPHLYSLHRAGFPGRQDQPHPPFRRLVLSVQNGRLQRCRNRARNWLGSDKLSLGPDQSAAQRDGHARNGQGKAQVRITSLHPKECDSRHGQAQARNDDGRPVPGGGRDEPAGDPHDQRHQCPRCQVKPPPDKESFNLLKPAGQVASHAPRAMLQCSGMRRIAAHRHLRQSFATHGSR